MLHKYTLRYTISTQTSIYNNTKDDSAKRRKREIRSDSKSRMDDIIQGHKPLISAKENTTVKVKIYIYLQNYDVTC